MPFAAWIHPSVCQWGIGDSISEQSADRADEIAGMYHTLVVGTVLPEAPENWTLRDKPEDLRMTLVGMLGDLQHLAVAAEIDWARTAFRNAGVIRGRS